MLRALHTRPNRVEFPSVGKIAPCRLSYSISLPMGLVLDRIASVMVNSVLAPCVKAQCTAVCVDKWCAGWCRLIYRPSTKLAVPVSYRKDITNPSPTSGKGAHMSREQFSVMPHLFSSLWLVKRGEMFMFPRGILPILGHGHQKFRIMFV